MVRQHVKNMQIIEDYLRTLPTQRIIDTYLLSLSEKRAKEIADKIILDKYKKPWEI